MQKSHSALNTTDNKVEAIETICRQYPTKLADKAKQLGYTAFLAIKPSVSDHFLIGILQAAAQTRDEKMKAAIAAALKVWDETVVIK